MLFVASKTKTQQRKVEYAFIFVLAMVTIQVSWNASISFDAASDKCDRWQCHGFTKIPS